jgi:spore coat polysaccharide biosynthesis predicted glycosyltransferase SpsG
VLHDVDDMARYMGRATLAICAAGSTTWELAALGVPALLVQVAPHQAIVAHGATTAGFGTSLGDAQAFAAQSSEAYDKLRIETLALLANPEQRLAMSRAGQRSIDGAGVFRVLHALLDVAFTPH